MSRRAPEVHPLSERQRASNKTQPRLRGALRAKPEVHP